MSIFETRSVSQRGWNVGLQIGDSITIPVVGYTYIKEAHPSTMKILYAPDPSLPLRAVTKYCTQDADPSDLNSSEVTRGKNSTKGIYGKRCEVKIMISVKCSQCLMSNNT